MSGWENFPVTDRFGDTDKGGEDGNGDGWLVSSDAPAMTESSGGGYADGTGMGSGGGGMHDVEGGMGGANGNMTTTPGSASASGGSGGVGGGNDFFGVGGGTASSTSTTAASSSASVSGSGSVSGSSPSRKTTAGGGGKGGGQQRRNGPSRSTSPGGPMANAKGGSGSGSGSGSGRGRGPRREQAAAPSEAAAAGTGGNRRPPNHIPPPPGGGSRGGRGRGGGGPSNRGNRQAGPAASSSSPRQPQQPPPQQQQQQQQQEPQQVPTRQSSKDPFEDVDGARTRARKDPFDVGGTVGAGAQGGRDPAKAGHDGGSRTSLTSLTSRGSSMGGGLSEKLGAGGSSRRGGPGGAAAAALERPPSGRPRQHQQEQKLSASSSQNRRTSGGAATKNPRFEDVERTGQWGESLSVKERIGITVFICTVVIVIVVVVVVVAIKPNQGISKTGSDNTSPGSAQGAGTDKGDDAVSPTPAPTSREVYGLKLIRAASPNVEWPGDPVTLFDMASTASNVYVVPQYKAAKFVLYDDANPVPPSSPWFLQKYGMYTLWLALGGDAGADANDKGGGWTTGWDWTAASSSRICNSFHGIECDFAERYVTELNLPSNGLFTPNPTGGGGGTMEGIPYELSALTKLKALDFDDNDIGGPIPTDAILDLKDLTTATFKTNRLTGTIPPKLNQSNLVYLSLDENLLQGSVPFEFCNLEEVRRNGTVNVIQRGIKTVIVNCQANPCPCCRGPFCE